MIRGQVSGAPDHELKPMVSLNSYLMLGAVLFSIGAVGVFTQRNALIIGPLLLMGFVLALWYAFNRSQNSPSRTRGSPGDA